MPLEQDKQGGFKFPFGDEMGSGLFQNLFSDKIPLWEVGENIHFTDLGVEKISGWSKIIDTGNGEPIRGMVQIIENTSDPIVYAGDLTNLYRVDVEDGTITNVGSGYSLSIDSGGSIWDTGTSTWDAGTTVWDAGIVQADHWSMVNYGSFIMATSGADAPQIKKTAGPFTSMLTESNMDVTTVEIFVKRGPHVLGFNTSTSDREFIWSAADDVDDWVASTSNLAGQLEIRELKTPIIAAVPLGNRIAVYGSDQMYLVNYLANDLVFGYQPALNGIGAVSKHSVVPVGRKNYGLSEQGFFVTDGVDFEYIDEPAMRKYYQNNAGTGQLAKTIGFHSEADNQIRWYFPTDSSAITRGVTYNYRKGTWAVIVNDRSAGDERRIFPTPISGSETGSIYSEAAGTNAGTEAMVAWVRTKPMKISTADAVKELDSVRIGFNGQGLQYRIGWAETEDGTVTWTPYASMATGFDFHNLRTAGRWLLFELYSNTLNAEWEVQAVEFIGRMEGTR
jgi:hypothetical protein